MDQVVEEKWVGVLDSVDEIEVMYQLGYDLEWPVYIRVGVW